MQSKAERYTATVFIGIIGFFLEGWMLMLFLGGVHHEVLSSVNPIGYWTACILSVPLDILFTSYFAMTSNRVDEIHKSVVL
ncbi:hypothetical protein PP459_gp091 [Streptomyces phage Wakanda]|uniref:Uncharacterized protein n=2 Tax=Wakandavirus TaxID=3044854 RepID=A0A6G8R3D0_9CAUD|nr:hypothetical protein PP459_gp091 [Streptomyces phage Wakanda]YP_010652463.1 hypothetical protein PP460_gp095 [Streptomyces phage Muntaha]QIN94142.1 hypothetical protein SEA_WAKANDA_181 [Streptomyces phage Wakanda]QIN94707.1 hypothetical protein SEA_MUNTAHA_183 [Streptomyces phage Muntaha]